MRKILSIIVIAFLALLNFNLLKSSYESQQKLSQIAQEEEKIKEIEKTNTTLKERLQEAQSSFFVEKEARNHLGFGRPGETIILVEENISERNEREENEKKSNFQKWIDLLKI